jgi:hypothetical protein
MVTMTLNLKISVTKGVKFVLSLIALRPELRALFATNLKKKMYAVIIQGNLPFE